MTDTPDTPEQNDPISIADFQALIHKMYFEKDQARGIAGTGSNLVSIQNPDQGRPERNVAQQSRKTVENTYAVPKTTEKTRVNTPRTTVFFFF